MHSGGTGPRTRHHRVSRGELSRCRNARRERLLGLLEHLGLGAALLRTPANFAHYTNGADNRVDRADPCGVAVVLVSPEGEWVITDNIEAARFREEETPELQVAEYPWYEGAEKTIRELTGDASLGSDLPATNEREISGELAALRYVLDPDATERYRLVCADAAAALSETAAAISPDTHELEAAAELEASLRRRGLNSAVLLAGGEERAARYRHPAPRAGTYDRIGGRAMLVACAERGGLYANTTRILELDEPSPESRRLQRVCDNILARARLAARPGRTLAQVFEEITRAYREEGFPEAWKEHHQGGITGYASREMIATPRTQTEIRESMAFAFNPSLVAPGGEFAKAEETFLLTRTGPEVLTEEDED